ncbi:MAG: septal ring lytic transglycosylase RlpA family protein [Alphaproteobacteria bacterium]|nr:septal ring lytic transglycosylase RlpA family protein [Alphaproteobacteria bacterium]MBV8549427.1 septal ring lytic transglycosylase RlpA family protein [Alphaproteobacteria bacterium]
MRRLQSFTPASAFALRFASVTVLGFLTACASSSGGQQAQGQGQLPSGAHYKVGEPYQINGAWFYPKEDYSYDETGIASWYGDAFHEGTTANGEIFNKNELTAAHKTLPLPTLARVTNLDNGRSIVVRINDRGPFSGARIIDVSQRAAQLLGFEGKGTAKVRVQVLADESKAIADAMRHYGGAAPAALASAETAPAPQSAALAAVETKTLEPVQTTPAVHQQLLQTKPVAQYVQLPVAAAGKIYVQGGAFTVLDNATKLQQELSKFGPVSVSDIQINGTMFHRVRVGPVASVDEADKLLSRIKRSGILNARTVVQ